jgi:rare lipoprotein A
MLALALGALGALAVLAAALSTAAPAIAASGGSGLSPGGSGLPSGSGSSSGSSSASTQNGDVTVSGTGDGVTLVTHASAMLRNQLSFTGSASPSDAGATIEIERLGHQTNWQWTPTAQATVGSDGSFSAAWQTDHIGRFAMRALITSSSGTAYAASSMPTVTIIVYRQSIATQYGPGFYGKRTACGTKLKPSTIGVANRTLKCGSKVSVYYHGRTMIIPVIDRGPYANHADWDLTTAAAKALGIAGTATIGAVSLPTQP